MKVSVVIPCFKVQDFILDVISRISKDIHQIIIVDDCCPGGSGKIVSERCSDSRVRVVFHDKNLGVGGATMTGYRKAVEGGAEIVVKLDGDGQMEPELIPTLVRPILEGYADYTKGNRFYSVEGLSCMPTFRLLGNISLSFLTKMSSGYWKNFDPTNGFTAIHSSVICSLPLEKIEKRYFFESDILFRLNILQAVVEDVPMEAQYGDEESSLNVLREIPSFALKHMRNLMKRIIYNYFLRDFSVASLELIFGFILFVFGLCFGGYNWNQSISSGVAVSSGTVMLSALPFLIGVQLILAFLSFDMANNSTVPIHKKLHTCSGQKHFDDSESAV